MAGNKNSGRTKGSLTRQTTAVRQCVINAFEDIGGWQNLAKWAKENPDKFYTQVLTKIIPTTVEGSGEGGRIEIILKTDLDAPASKLLLSDEIVEVDGETIQ